MIKTTFTIAIILTFIAQSFSQVNPINNLTYEDEYDMPITYFILEWDEPTSPHDELIGYNVYREDELYRFQTETSLYYLENDANCGDDFLFYNNSVDGFYAHVTAVYNPGGVESDYTETVFVGGPLLKTNQFKKEKSILYPNPTDGELNIVNKNINAIQVFDATGKLVKELKPQPQIDLFNLSNGIYFVKLNSDNGVLINKIIVE